MTLQPLLWNLRRMILQECGHPQQSSKQSAALRQYFAGSVVPASLSTFDFFAHKSVGSEKRIGRTKTDNYAEITMILIYFGVMSSADSHLFRCHGIALAGSGPPLHCTVSTRRPVRAISLSTRFAIPRKHTSPDDIAALSSYHCRRPR